MDIICREGESLSPSIIVAVLLGDFSAEIGDAAIAGGMTTSVPIPTKEGPTGIEVFDWAKDVVLSPFSVVSSSTAFPREAGGVVVIF